MNDFQTFYEIGIFAANGKDIYQAAPSTGMVVYYLPIFALVMSLLSLFPLNVAAGLWTFGKVFVVAFLLNAITKVPIESIDEKKKGQTYKKFHIFIAILGIATSLIADFALGQFNTFLTAGFLAIWLLSRSSSRKNEHLAACVFAIISSKLTPFALLPMVIIKRKWSLAFWMLTYSIGLNLAASAIIGVPIEDLLVTLNATANQHKLSVVELTNIKNQAIVGMLGRLYLEYIDLILPKYFVHVVVASASGFFGLMMLRYWKKWHPNFCSELSLRDISIAILISLILSPDTRSAHLVQLFVPMLLLSGWIAVPGVKFLLLCVLVFVGFAGTTLIGENGLAFIRSHSLQGITLLAIVGVILLKHPKNKKWKRSDVFSV